jgi:flagellar assembly protein FliH
MSAKLIKGAAACFSPFSFPEAEESLQRAQLISPSVHADEFEPTTRKLDLGEDEQAIERARELAEQIVAEAEARASQIEAEARERGLAEGRALASLEMNQALETLRTQLAETIEEIHLLKQTIAAQAERDLVRLAIEIARKIVHREVTVDPEVVLAITRVALRRIHDQTSVTIHLHPDDYRYVKGRGDSLAHGGTVELVEDPSIERGGCLIRTQMGDVDARIERQFAEIARGFFDD